MALQATLGTPRVASRRMSRRPQREAHDLTLIFWSIATPACLLFWAAIAYGIHSIF